MKIYFLLNTIFLFLLFNFVAKAQEDTLRMVVDSTMSNEETTTVDIPKPVLNETNNFIINKWEISEYKENGKVDELPNYEIEFFEDGTYSAIEEEDFDNGTWNIGANNSSIIFDELSTFSEVWNIVTLEPKKIVVRFSSEGKTYEYTFIPWVKRQQ